MLFEVISIYIIISIVTITFFSAFIQARGKGSYVAFIFLLSLAIDFYLFGYLQELTSVTLSRKLFWNYFQYLGIPFISALWLTVALVYTNHFQRYRIAKIIFIYSVPVLTLILRFTNHFNHLYFTSLQLQTFGDYSLLVKQGGIGYALQGCHSGLLIIISLLVYIEAFVKNRGFEHENIKYLIGASLVACLGLVLKTNRISIDYMALFLPVIMLLILMAIFQSDFLEIKILAREQVFESSKDGILLLNSKLKILDFNESAISILKNCKFNLAKKPLDAVIHQDDPLNAILKSSISTVWKAEDLSGTKYYEITTANIFHKNGTVYGTIKTFRDITKIQVRTNNLKVQANFDELSGLLNRRAFINSCRSILNANLTSKNRYFLFMLDLDFFKRVNDTYGHVAGDQVIENFGALLKQNFRSSDLIGRLGGEEFAVFIDEKSMDSAFMRAEQFRQSVEIWPFLFNNEALKITVSIGIAEVNKSDSANDAINKADKALYVSKK